MLKPMAEAMTGFIKDTFVFFRDEASNSISIRTRLINKKKCKDQYKYESCNRFNKTLCCRKNSFKTRFDKTPKAVTETFSDLLSLWQLGNRLTSLDFRVPIFNSINRFRKLLCEGFEEFSVIFGTVRSPSPPILPISKIKVKMTEIPRGIFLENRSIGKLIKTATKTATKLNNKMSLTKTAKAIRSKVPIILRLCCKIFYFLLF